MLDEDWRPCAAGETGQLHIGGSGLADGYWRDPERTAASFARHPITGERLYRTGDYGRRLPDGTIEFLGRRDAQVKIGGHRIELAEVEHAMLAVPGVAEAVALSVEDSAGNPRLCAAYSTEIALADTALRSALAARLPHYMIPSMLLALPKLPLTANGKVDRGGISARLAEPLGHKRPAEEAATHPATVIESLLSTPCVLADPDSRRAFAAAAPGTRRDLSAPAGAALGGGAGPG